jgi:hypothetical protein
MLTRRAWILGAGGALFFRSSARAEAGPGLELRLSAPPALEVGARASIVAELFIPGERAAPLLLTPTAEGTAVEVVRGRLTGRDGAPMGSEDGRRALRFAIPIAAHMEGISVLRVRAQTFVCAPACHPAEAEARLTLRVRRGALARPRAS